MRERLVLILVLTAAVVPNAEARRCADTAMGSVVLGSNGENLEARWVPTVAGHHGIASLFMQNPPGPAPATPCANCHSRPGAAGAFDAYQPCYTCHSATVDVGAGSNRFPAYLVFDDVTTDASGRPTGGTLFQNSYYNPGFSKAYASLRRGIDQTMPPGQHGWCDEINEKVQQWIDAGFP